MQASLTPKLFDIVVVRALKLVLRATVRVVAVIGGYMLATGYYPGLKAILDAVNAAGVYAIIFAVCGALLDLVMRTDRAFWRYSSIADVPRIVRSSAILCGLFLVAAFFIQRATELPRSALLVVFVLDVALTLSLLLLRRLLHEPALLAGTPFPGFISRDDRQPLVLLGDLDKIDTFLRDVDRGSQTFRPVGIVTRGSGSYPREIRGVRVFTSIERAVDLAESLLARDEVPAVLFTDDTLSPADFGMERLGRLRANGVKLLRIPSLAELGGTADGSSMREFQLEELLPRPPVNLDEAELKRLISGRRIMVTGGGGSIGSEICRQVAKLGCSHLTLLDDSEFGLFAIDQEIGDQWPTLSRNAVLCNVRGRAQVRKCFERDRPDLVFHAAALKHVPLMEKHPAEAILTNVIGTRNVAEAAHAAGAAHMVFISTDKAVAPPNVMGATKRLAESVVRAQQMGDGATRFSAVRFGNVLGSAGSVVPTFRSQIERGGPVTLTHPEIERYFMTIPEAVQLVLHATATSDSLSDGPLGVFVLDMGKPVKIIDLARQLIELYGKTPGRDVEIAITGLRPGEKLYEDLVDSSEEIRFRDEKVMCVMDRVTGLQMSQRHLDELEFVALSGDEDAARDMIFNLLAKVRAEGGKPLAASDVVPIGKRQ